MRYLRSVVQPTATLTASAQFGPIDLPVNPLSGLFLSFSLTNVAPAALDTWSVIDDIINQITSVIVKHKGENILQGSLRDLMVLNAIMARRYPGAHSMSNAVSDVRRVTFPLSFGRRMFDPMECFPATSRGNLTIELTAGALGAAYSAVTIQIESVELIEADPRQYVKYTTQSRTSVVGQFDQPLPIGNPLLKIIGFDTAMATPTTGLSSWGTVKLLKDNIEQYYPNSDALTLAGELRGLFDQGGSWQGHTHQFNGAAAGLDESDDIDLPATNGSSGYFLLDFDPLNDGAYMLETAGAADLKVRGVGTAASAVRLLPVELVGIKAR
jgi:hypothetical protein